MFCKVFTLASENKRQYTNLHYAWPDTKDTSSMLVNAVYISDDHYQFSAFCFRFQFPPFPLAPQNGHFSIFLSLFPGLTEDYLDRSPWFSYKSILFCSAQCSGKLVWRYLDSYVIVGVCGALTIGCVWYAILWYNAHAWNVLPWWSHVTAPGPRRGQAKVASYSLG